MRAPRARAIAATKRAFDMNTVGAHRTAAYLHSLAAGDEYARPDEDPDPYGRAKVYQSTYHEAMVRDHIQEGQRIAEGRWTCPYCSQRYHEGPCGY
jgi:hypothetical protein